MSKQDPQPPSSGGQQNIVHIGEQYGGIGQQVNNFQMQTDPSIDAQLVRQAERDQSGQMLSEWKLSLKQQQAARGLEVQVEGAPGSIRNVRMNPDPNSGPKEFGTAFSNEGPPWVWVVRRWLPPLAAAYRIEVWTKEPGPLTLRAGFVDGG